MDVSAGRGPNFRKAKGVGTSVRVKEIQLLSWASAKQNARNFCSWTTGKGNWVYVCLMFCVITYSTPSSCSSSHPVLMNVMLSPLLASSPGTLTSLVLMFGSGAEFIPASGNTRASSNLKVYHLGFFKLLGWHIQKTSCIRRDTAHELWTQVALGKIDLHTDRWISDNSETNKNL